MRHVLACAAALLAAAGLSAVPAGAFEKEPALVIAEGQTIDEDYSAAPVGAAGEEANPGTCRSRPDCDVVPLKIVVPERLKSPDTAEDFFVRVSMSWPEDVDGPIGTSENDMDMYIWEDPAGDDDVASGASSANPERASLVNPRNGDYSIVVVNWAGTNRGYNLHVEWISGEIPTPYEALAPGRTSSGGGSDEGTFVPPEDTSGEPVDESAFSPVPAAPTAEPEAAPRRPIAGDDAFGFSLPRAPALSPSLGDSSEEAASLFDSQPAVSLGPAEPVPAPVVLFWLLAVPMVLLGGSFLWLRQHRPAALIMGT